MGTMFLSSIQSPGPLLLTGHTGWGLLPCDRTSGSPNLRSEVPVSQDQDTHLCLEFHGSWGSGLDKGGEVKVVTWFEWKPKGQPCLLRPLFRTNLFTSVLCLLAVPFGCFGILTMRVLGPPILWVGVWTMWTQCIPTGVIPKVWLPWICILLWHLVPELQPVLLRFSVHLTSFSKTAAVPWTSRTPPSTAVAIGSPGPWCAAHCGLHFPLRQHGAYPGVSTMCTETQQIGQQKGKQTKKPTNSKNIE